MFVADWLFQQWHDIKGNVKFALIMGILGVVGAIIKMLVNGLNAWQQIVLVTIFLLLFGWCLFTTWQIIKPKVVLEASVSSPSGVSTRSATGAAIPEAFLGTSSMQMIFPGNGEIPEPVTGANVNVYRWNAFRY